MKVIIITILLPYVLGECPPADPPNCEGSQLLCGGEPQPDGCQAPFWCMWNDPYASCSARAFCPTTCPEGTIQCWGGNDEDGCPMPDTCVQENPDCMTNCPANCGPNEMMCPGGVGPDGCPWPDTCEWIDPQGMSFCPAHCNEEEIVCRSVGDMTDYCLPMDKDCPTYCPPPCGSNEMMCEGGVEPESGCPRADFCIPYDSSAICNYECPINCPMNEWPCPMGQDDMGCNLPETCSVDGKCPEGQVFG